MTAPAPKAVESAEPPRAVRVARAIADEGACCRKCKRRQSRSRFNDHGKHRTLRDRRR